MTPDELYDAFRSDVTDTAAPYFWSDSEVWRYMNDAYVMFVRLIGGVPDSSSDVTQVNVVAGEADAEVSPLILKFREARLLSTGRKLDIFNHIDVPVVAGRADTLPGAVRAMLIGKQRGLVTWIQVPEVGDTVSLLVDRLPRNTITGASGDHLDEVDAWHHEHLLPWMKARAYGKQDADTFDKARSDLCKAEFTDYCKLAKAEWERAKSKVRSVAYGGI